VLKLRSYRNVVPLGVQWQWMGIRWEAMPGQASGPRFIHGFVLRFVPVQWTRGGYRPWGRG